MFFTVATDRQKEHTRQERKKAIRMSALLHTYNDGSRLMRSTVYELLEFGIWRGQRIFDAEHAKRLKDSIERLENLDCDYHVIVKREVHADGRVIEIPEVVGGQHRLSILREAKASGFFPDFPVTYTLKYVDSEAEAEAYFNKISSSKPMHFDEDPGLMVGRFIVALEKEFTPATKKEICMKQCKTTRPFLYIEAVREVMKDRYIDSLRRTKPVDFAKRVWEWNRKKVVEFGIIRSSGKGDAMMDKCITRNFALAHDDKLPWIAACM
jgi:hypothetical protein